MPILTADNLTLRAWQARSAIDACDTPPATIDDLKSRIAARPKSDGKRAVAFVLGPVKETRRATAYGPHFVMGVTDHEHQPEFSPRKSGELRTIESVLSRLLNEFPVDAGFDIVLATIPMIGDSWDAGLKGDFHLRECHAKARRTALAEGLRHVWYLKG